MAPIEDYEWNEKTGKWERVYPDDIESWDGKDLYQDLDKEGRWIV